MQMNIAIRVTLVLALLGGAASADCMGPYPPSMVRAFNQNCAKQPSMQPFCGCIIDEVQKNIPLVDFIEIGNSAAGINNDPRFVKASQKCTPLLTGGVPLATPAPATAAAAVIQPVQAPGGTVPPAAAVAPVPAGLPAGTQPLTVPTAKTR